MSGMKKPWHRGGYQRQAAAVRAYAYRNPSTRCMTCRRTLAEIHATRPDAKWTAGHVNDSEIGGSLAPECGPCNYGKGARLTNSRRRPASNPHSRVW